MSFTFRPAKRENVPLLLGLAGGTGSGKTYSAMLLARGLAEGKPFAVIDTENGRALHYADDFDFHHGELHAPFRPDRYADAIEAADKGYDVIVVDSASHEHAGDGGLLDWHEEEFQRLGGRDAVKMTAWIKPKMAHRKMVSRLLQVRAHVILCFRAEEKIEIGKDADGKTVVRPKRSLVGLDGWVPVSEKTLPYELTASFLLTADQPGVPKPIKLQEQHRAFVPLDQPLTEDTGRRLAEWARGGEEPARDEVDALSRQLIDLLIAIGKGDTLPMIAKHREANDAARHMAWLRRQIAAAEAAAETSGPGDLTSGSAEPEVPGPEVAEEQDGQTALKVPAAVAANMARERGE